MQLNNYYCFKNNPSEIEDYLGINYGLLEDVVRWHDQAAINEYQKFKLQTMDLFGWKQEDYNINFEHYKSKVVNYE